MKKMCGGRGREGGKAEGVRVGFGGIRRDEGWEREGAVGGVRDGSGGGDWRLEMGVGGDVRDGGVGSWVREKRKRKRNERIKARSGICTFSRSPRLCHSTSPQMLAPSEVITSCALTKASRQPHPARQLRLCRMKSTCFICYVSKSDSNAEGLDYGSDCGTAR